MKAAKLRFFLAGVALSVTGAAAQSNWTWQNPWPQGNDLRAVWVQNERRILAAGDNGTLLRSSDAGLTWEVTHRLGGICEDIVDIQFIDDNRGWALANRCRPADYVHDSKAYSVVMWTTDGGASWSTTSTFDNVRLNDLCFVNEDLGWMLGYVPPRTLEDTLSGIVFKTLDGGYHWDTLLVQAAPYQDENEDRIPFWSIQFIDENTGWMAGRFYADVGGELLQTSDGGATWTVVNDSLTCVKEFQFQNPSKGWLIQTYSRWVSGYSVDKTLDGGVTWQTVFAAAAMWDHVPTPSLHFVNDSLGWVSVPGRIYKTTDGGTTWSADTLECPLYSAMHFRDEMNGCVVGACGQVMNTQDGGHTWRRTTRRVMGEHLASIDFVDEATGWVVGDTYRGTWEGGEADGRIFKTTDGGSSWIEQLFVPGGYGGIAFADVEAVSDQVVYAAKGSVYKTADGGTTWSRLDALGDWGITTLSFPDENTGFAGKGADVSPAKVYKTTDGGASWQSVLSATHDFWSVFFLTPSVGWVVGESPIYRTTDGGNTWQATPATNLLLMSVFFIDARNGWAAGTNYDRRVIVRSSDGGENWSVVYEAHEYDGTSLGGSIFSSVFFTDSLNGIAVGGSGDIISTTDGGARWDHGFQGASKHLNDVRFINKNTGWIVGRDGTILKTTTGGATFVRHTLCAEMPRIFSLSQNYPNPFNPTTAIKYELPKSAVVRLSVYDLLGREVSVLVNERMDAGVYEVSFDGSGLSSGVYFCRLSAGTFTETKRLLLLR